MPPAPKHLPILWFLKKLRDIIKTFGVDKYGSPLFFPDAGKKVEDLGK